jgi:sugar lactone lactonase YvrE
VAVDSAGTVYVADANNNRIRQVTAAGVVTTLAGGGLPGGFDGTGSAARFNVPEGVAVDSAGVVYVADTFSDTIRKITAGGVVTTLAGFYGSVDAVDGQGAIARFSSPVGVAADPNGNIYVADRTNQTVRKVTRAGNVTTFAGLANTIGSTDGTGSAARFSAPQGVAVDAAGTVYIGDTNNHTIRTITPGGVVTTLAGLAGSSGSTDGTGGAARFNGPRGVAVDSAGTLYVADTNNHTIRKIAPGGVVTTLAGLAGSSGSADGTGSAARFNRPGGVAVDGAGTLYVADTGQSIIRKITPGGVVTTLAGFPGAFGWNDAVGSAARFAGPSGIAVDNATGTLYVADTGSETIRKITAGAVVTTVGGCPFCPGAENWGRFSGPQGITVNARGEVFVADTRNNTIRTSAPLPSSLVVDFGPQYGIWIRRGQDWSQLHPYTAEEMVRIHGEQGRDALVIDFGPGVGVWVYSQDPGEEGWFQLHAGSPSAMVGVDFDGDGETDSGVFDFPGQGLWLLDDDFEWSLLHPMNALQLAAADLNGDGGEDVIVDFQGYGLWVVYGNGTWAQFHPFDVSAIVIADLDGNHRSDVVVNFPGYGVWAYMNGTAWAPIHAFEAKRLAAGDLDGNGTSDLIVDFGATYGVWTRQNGPNWAPLHYLTTDGIATGDLDGNGHDEVIIDFGAAGVWSWEDVGLWKHVHGLNPKSIVTARF